MNARRTEPIGDVLRSYFRRHGLVRRVAQAGVVAEWADLVGPQVAGVTEPTSVDAAGTLWVRVQSAAWMQELQLMSPTVIRELGKHGKRIKQIRWMLAPLGSDRDVGARRRSP